MLCFNHHWKTSDQWKIHIAQIKTKILILLQFKQIFSDLLFLVSVNSVAQQYSNYVFSYEYINIFLKVIWGEKDIEIYLKFSHSMISKIKNIKTFNLSV